MHRVVTIRSCQLARMCRESDIVATILQGRLHNSRCGAGESLVGSTAVIVSQRILLNIHPLGHHAIGPSPNRPSHLLSIVTTIYLYHRRRHSADYCSNGLREMAGVVGKERAHSTKGSCTLQSYIGRSKQYYDRAVGDRKPLTHTKKHYPLTFSLRLWKVVALVQRPATSNHRPLRLLSSVYDTTFSPFHTRSRRQCISDSYWRSASIARRAVSSCCRRCASICSTSSWRWISGSMFLAAGWRGPNWLVSSLSKGRRRPD